LSDFAHLHVHSEFSLLDGVGRLERLVAQAKALDMAAIALTDHGVLYGAIDFYSEAQSAGLKPIIGCEVYVAPGSRTDRRGKTDGSPQHLVLLAQDDAGYRNLVQLVTKAHLEGFYYKPRVDKELLAAHSQGLMCLSACASGEVPRLIQSGDPEGARKAAAWYRDVYGKENYVIELQRHDGLEWLDDINRELIAIARELDLAIVATNDVHYVEPSDARSQDLLLCIQTNATVDDPKRMRMTGTSYYLKSPAEMRALFAEVPEALGTSLAIAERCDLKLKFDRVHLPQFDLPEGYTPETYLEKLCREGLKKRYPRLTPEVDERLRYELQVIKETGFAQYILIVWDMVAFARKQGIMCGPRGSAAGALVLYLIGISDVDPVANNLTFERFLNIERKEMPDVDMDFADDRRDEVIEYVTQKYGRDHVSQIITFGTLGAKAAIRDVGRARGLPFGDVDRVAKLVPTLPVGITIEQALADNPDLKRLHDEDEVVRSLIADARSIEGIARHASTHAAGVVISKDPLSEIVPLQHTTRNDSAVMSQYPMGAVAKIGLLKMDFLGLANLTILGRTLEIIKRTRGITIDLLRLPQDDAKTFAMLGRGETVGVFQVEGRGMTQYLRELRPTSIADVAAMIALYRPGPMNNIPHYIARKHGDEPVEYPHPLLEEVLRDTYGVLTYQDQVLQVLRRVAGYSLGQADIVRKAMGKKVRALMEKEQPRFLQGARKNGVSEADALVIWELLEPFAGYGFNRAHACCYAMVAYQTAYLKANYPAEYMVAVLLAGSGNTEKVVTAIAEARRLSIVVLPPDVNRSEVHFAIEDNGGTPAIRWGLAAIKNVGESAVQPMIAARAQGPFASIDDLCQRVDLRGTNKRVLESMVKAGAFDGLGRRAQLLAVLDRLLAVAQKNHQASDAGQTSLFDVLPVEPESVAITLPEVSEAASTERLAWEKELLGLYLSDHPMQRAAAALLDKVTAQMAELSEDLVGQRVTVGGMLRQLRPLVTKKKDAMIAAALEDLTGTVDLVAFPRTYEKTRDVWLADRVVLVKGKLDVREERYQVVVDEIEPFEVDAEDEPRVAARVASPPTVAVPANGGGPSPRPTANVVAPDVAVTVRVAPSREASNGSGLGNGSNGSGPNGHGANGHGATGAADSNGHGASARRRLVLRLRRSADGGEDVKLLNQIGVILRDHAGGSDSVELIISGADRPRVELEWPDLKIRWDRQLKRSLDDVLGPDAVRLETPDEAERAVVT
jgi:DNA polymerase III subunit alpha